MAEQEACADLVEKASQDQPDGKIEGESLLLPLLQGLLAAPEKDQTADSGIESGEDQRNGLIAEVQNALDKLSQSLCNDSTDISQERRSSLLYLVTKLQAGLSSAIPKVERRLSTEPGRFNRKKNRQNRHTVGVSSEELADARRLMEEISSHKEAINIRKDKSESNVSTSSVISKTKNESEASVLSKQNSDSSVTSNPSINKYLNKSTVKNNTPKPFSSSNNSSTVQTPDISDFLEEFFKEEKPLYEDTVKTTNLEDEDIKPSVQLTLQVETPKEQAPRFNSNVKKQKMKRANTIDIPKPLHFYEETDSDNETEAQQHKNNYYALRGPIRLVPSFEPKTTKDQKFLALLNKNQNLNESKNSSWTNQNNRAQVWESRFGNIKNNFENVSRSGNNSTVKNFWKSQDDAITSRTNQYGPKISRQSARNLQQMFEDKRRESQEKVVPKQETVTGKLVLKPEPKVAPGPLPVNKFSHAPQSAFKPIPKRVSTLEPTDLVKTEIKETNESSLFLYSPKPLNDSNSSSPALSPIITKPWLTNENRVINLAAKKFEFGNIQNDAPMIKPRKLSKELTSAFVTPTIKDKLPTAYISRSDTKSSTVRKLSDQYNNLGSKNPEYPSRNSSFKYASTETKSSPWMVDNYAQRKSSDNIGTTYQPIYQHVPGKEKTPENVYTSTLTFNPNLDHAPPKLQTQLSNESVHEYTAINSKVMGGCQQAVTVRQKSPMTRNEHDLAAAFSLKNTLTNIGTKASKDPTKTQLFGVVKPMQQNNNNRIQSSHNHQFVEYNEKGQGVVTSKFHIPVVNVEPTSPGAVSPSFRGLAKSDSWHQICLASQSPTTTRSQPARNVVKSKSSHSLAVPQRQFQAGMSKEELLSKKRAMEAYLIGGSTSPKEPIKTVKSSINRIKTSEKHSAFKSSGIARSRTLPDIVCPTMLDENNVDQAFEDLFKASS